MKLIKTMIQKKMERYNIYSEKKFEIRSIWQFAQALNLSLAILGEKVNPKDKKMVNILYNRILSSKKLNEKQFRKIKDFINENMSVITRAIEHLEKMNEESTHYLDAIDKDDCIMILAYEHEGLGD